MLDSTDLPAWDEDRVATAGVVSIAREHAAQVDTEGVLPEAALAAMRAAGLLGAMVPRAMGGHGLPPSRIAALAAELGAACSSSGMIFAMHQIQVACLIGHATPASWHRQFLTRVASDGLLLASVTSEVGTGGKMRASRCAVESAGDGRLRVSKNATAISYGAYADAFLITARWAGHPGNGSGAGRRRARAVRPAVARAVGRDGDARDTDGTVRAQRQHRAGTGHARPVRRHRRHEHGAGIAPVLGGALAGHRRRRRRSRARVPA